MTAPMPSPLRRITSGLASLILAAALTVGVPVLLWRLAGWPLPDQIPTLDSVSRALSRSSVSDAVVLNALALVGWAAWGLLCWSLLVETCAWARGRPARNLRVAGPIQDLARNLVTAVSLLVATGMSSANAAPEFATTSAAIEEGVRHAAPPLSMPVAVPTESAAASDTYTVQRRDSLWRIADCQLGDPLRWREIWDLNRGRDFDGVTFADPNLIYSGWTLELPTTIIPATETAPPSTAPPPAVGEQLEPEVEPPTPPAIEQPATTTTARAAAVDPSPPETTAASPARGGSTATAEDPVTLETPTRMPLVAGGVALATALVLILDRLRRSQARRRRLGRAPHRPPADTTAIETSIRRAADPPRMHRLTAALRAFANGLPATSIPELAAVRVGDDEVEILLATPTTTTPPGFDDRGDQRAFGTETGISTARLEGLAGDTTAPWPTVVTVGCLGDDLVLVDLETAGVLTVTGDDAVDTVRRIAAELAVSPVSELVDLLVVRDEFDLATSDRIRSVPTVDDAIAALARSGAATCAALDQMGDADTTTARRDHSSEQGWSVTVFVSLSALTDTELQRVTDHAPPRSGVAAVVVGEPTPHGWSLRTGPAAHLMPHGFDLDPSHLGQHDLVAVGDLLADATAGDAEHELFAGPHTDTTADGVYLPDDTPPTIAASDVDIEVRLLGPVEVHGAAPINRRRTVELIAYLALHPGGVTSERLKTALWADATPSQDTFNVTVHRARSALGVDRDGNHHLPHAVTNGGRYSVGPHVTSDLARFADLVRRSRTSEDQPAEVQLLREALGLLRGQPFEGVTGYEWAFTEGTVVESEAMISDAAHRLAQLALGSGDTRLATWAATQGLTAVPGSEPLYRDRMEAAHLNGDPAAVDRIVDELCRYVEALDPFDDLHPDTIELWHRIGHPGRRSGGSSTVDAGR